MEREGEQEDVMLGVYLDGIGPDRTDRFAPIATHEDLTARLATFSPAQLRYLEAALGASTKRAALREADVSKSMFYLWPNRGLLEDTVRALRLDGALVTVGRERLRRLAGQAIDVLGENLDPRVAVYAKDRNQAAAEILNRAGLGATSNVRIELARPAEESQQYIARLQDARKSLLAAGVDLAADDDLL